MLLLVAGLGDDVQSFKAGVMEIADVFAINKADRGDTDRLENELKVMLGLSQRADRWRPPIVKTVATEGTGLAELAGAVEDYRAHLERNGLLEEKKVQRWRERLVDLIRERAVDRVARAGLGQDKLADYARQVARRERDPYSVVEELLRAAGMGA